MFVFIGQSSLAALSRNLRAAPTYRRGALLLCEHERLGHHEEGLIPCRVRVRVEVVVPTNLASNGAEAVGVRVVQGTE